MEDKNKHNLFSKEEFFKLLDEKRALPPDADDFDREAMEGFALVKDRKKLDTLNDSIDEVLRREKKLASRKRNLYYFSAAASLVLIVGLFFVLKENALKKADNLALNAPVSTEETVSRTEAAVDADTGGAAPLQSVAESQPKKPAAVATSEAGMQNELTEPVSAVPVEEKADKLTVDDNENVAGLATGESESYLADSRKAQGKDKPQDIAGKDEQTKETSNNKAEEKKAYKLAESDERNAVTYQTNTVWTTPAGAPKKEANAKQEGLASETKPQVQQDYRGTTVTGSTSDAAGAGKSQEQLAGNFASDEDKAKGKESLEKDRELVKNQKSNQSAFGKKKKARSRAKTASFEDAPAERPGYSFYTQSGPRDFTSAEFKGGEAALQNFIDQNLKRSEPAKKGTVVVEFTIKSSGTIDTTSIKVVSPIKNCEPCSKDVINLVKKMPGWQPASENGKPKEYRQKLSVVYSTPVTDK